MARKPRIILPGYALHVVQRGNNRQDCFFAEADYQRYREDLSEVAEHHGCAIHAYVLMTNHVHLLLTPRSSPDLACLMQDLGRRYVRYINDKYKRSGTLWSGRYKASLVHDERYLLKCMCYIELNPARVSAVKQPGAYPYSSYAHNALGHPDFLISPHSLYRALGATDSERQLAYRHLVESDLKECQLRKIREALNRQLVLGSDQFLDQIQAITNQRTRPGQPGRPREQLTCPSKFVPHDKLGFPHDEEETLQ